MRGPVLCRLLRPRHFHPVPENKLKKVFKKYPKAKFVWVQEEPSNMGPNSFLKRYDIFDDFDFITREESAAPATGFASVHQKEQEEIINKAFK